MPPAGGVGCGGHEPASSLREALNKERAKPKAITQMATGNESFTEQLRAIDRELGFEQGEIRGEVGVSS